jgi:molybdopterin-guanine dinucleotide biosynthesis protein A
MTRMAALILAGGKAKRFQTDKENWHDKALADLNGKPLLVHAVENVSSVVDEIIVCVNDEERKKRYSEVLAPNGFGGVKLVADEKFDGLGGPIIAILTGLKSTDADYCLTVPADMPMLKPQVADYMFSKIEDSLVVVPMWPSGRLETLIMLLKRQQILNVTATLIQLCRSRPLDIIRAASKTLLINPASSEIRMLDPEMKSFVNINSPQDLIALQARHTHGPAIENRRLNFGDLSMDMLQCLQETAVSGKAYVSESAKAYAQSAKNFEIQRLFFWAALCRENEGKMLLKSFGSTAESKTAMLKAAENYSHEAEIYQEKNCSVLAERAIADQAWCKAAASKS